MTVGGHHFDLGPWLIEILMHTPTAIADLQRALISQADTLIANSPADNPDSNEPDVRACRSDTPAPADSSRPCLADGDHVTYGTVYADPDGYQHVVYEASGDSRARRFPLPGTQPSAG